MFLRSMQSLWHGVAADRTHTTFGILVTLLPSKSTAPKEQILPSALSVRVKDVRVSPCS